VLSGIVLQRADDGYTRCRNFSGSLVHSTFSVYSPDGTNGLGSRGGEFERIGSVYHSRVLKVKKCAVMGALPIHLFRPFLPQCTALETDGQKTVSCQ